MSANLRKQASQLPNPNVRWPGKAVFERSWRLQIFGARLMSAQPSLASWLCQHRAGILKQSSRRACFREPQMRLCTRRNGLEPPWAHGLPVFSRLH
jgi:hypothetical protein